VTCLMILVVDWGGRTGFVEMRKMDSVDVDSPEDLELVRMLYDLQ